MRNFVTRIKIKLKNILPDFLRKIMRKLVRLIRYFCHAVIYPCFYIGWKIQSLFLVPPIFVVGCGHSGTSIMIRLLGNHGKIYSILGENSIFYSKPRWKIVKHFFLFNRKAVKNNKHRWVEKTPKHILKIDAIFKNIPEAKVIIMVRDGRDVTCSLKEKSGDFEAGLNRWIKDNEAALPFHSHQQVKIVKYEELVRNKEIVMKEVLSFLDEEYDEAIFSTDGNSWLPTSKISDHVLRRIEQIKSPIYDGSGRWKKEMTKEEKELFDNKADNLMRRLGYVCE